MLNLCRACKSVTQFDFETSLVALEVISIYGLWAALTVCYSQDPQTVGEWVQVDSEVEGEESTKVIGLKYTSGQRRF